MARQRNRNFWESTYHNSKLYYHFYDQLLNLAINRVKWENLPETCDERFLELALFAQGHALFFQDEITGQYFTLNCTLAGQMDIYRIPKERRVYTVDPNAPQWVRDKWNSVVIFNNRRHNGDMSAIELFAYRLYTIQSAIDVNMRQQKTPMFIRGSEEQIFSLKQIYEMYDGNYPVMFGDKQFSPEEMQVFMTTAPFLGHDLFTMYLNTWNDAYTYLGIESQSIDKRERVQSAEVTANLATVEANRLNIMTERETAAEKINKMFGLNINPTFRQITFKDGLTDMPSNNLDDGLSPIYNTASQSLGGER